MLAYDDEGNEVRLGESKPSAPKQDGLGLGMSVMQRLSTDPDLKLQPHHAAGVVGNLATETGWFKNMQEIQPTVAGSRGGYGWAQWTGPRRQQFEAFARDKGLDINSDEANYQFLKQELLTTERPALEQLKQATNYQEASDAFMAGYERPGVAATGSRHRNARKLMMAFGNGETATDAPSIGYTDDQVTLPKAITDADVRQTMQAEMAQQGQPAQGESQLPAPSTEGMSAEEQEWASIGKPQKPPSLLQSASNHAANILAGSADVAKAGAWGLEKLGAPGAAQTLRTVGDDAEKFWTSQMTPEFRQRLDKPVFDKDWNLNTDAIIPAIERSALGTVAMGAAGKALMAPLEIAGVAPRLTGWLGKLGVPDKAAKGLAELTTTGAAYGGAEGVYSGALTAEQVGQEIRNTKLGDLMTKSPKFMELLNKEPKTGNGVKRGAAAREKLAQMAEEEAFGKVALSTGLIGVLTGGGGLGMLERGVKDGFFKTVAKGAVSEGPLQEGPQSFGEAYILNDVRRKYVDPTIKPMDGTLQEAAGGAVVGAAMGAGMGGAGYASSPRPAEPQADPVVDPAATTQAADQADTTISSTGIPGATDAQDPISASAPPAGQAGQTASAEEIQPTPDPAATTPGLGSLKEQGYTLNDLGDGRIAILDPQGQTHSTYTDTQEALDAFEVPPTQEITNERQNQETSTAGQEGLLDATNSTGSIGSNVAGATAGTDLAPGAESGTGVGTGDAGGGLESGQPDRDGGGVASASAAVDPVGQPALTPILQNRNRSNPASVQQMQSIAGNPDYLRLSPSRNFAEGAPVIAGGTVPESQLGRKETTVTAKGRRIPVQYAVVEAGSVLASNNADGTVNAQYGDQTLQAPRAIAGNGRIAGLQKAYRQGSAQQYRADLEQDDLHGISPEVIQGMQNPVLVRLMPDSEITADIGDESNISGGLSLSPVEQAKNDAERLDLAGLDFDEDGTLGRNTVLQFVRSMPESEQGGLLDADGTPNRQAHDRLNSAVFQKAYDNEELVRLHSQAVDPEAKLVMSTLSRLAPKVSRLKGQGAFDVRPWLADAAKAIINGKRRDLTMQQIAEQQDLDIDPRAYDIIRLFADNPRSNKAVIEDLSDFADFTYNEATRDTTDMFGETPRATREDLVKRLENYRERRGQQNLAKRSRGQPVSGNPQEAATQPAGPDNPAQTAQAQSGLFGEPTAADRAYADREALAEAQREGQRRRNANNAPPADDGLFAQDNRQDELKLSLRPSERTEKINDLNDVIDGFNRRNAGEGKADPRSRVKAAEASDVPSARRVEMRLAGTIAAIFGHDVIYVQSESGLELDFDGLINPYDPSTLFIASDSASPISRVVAHELLHALRGNAPAIYDSLVASLRKVYKPGAVAEHLKRRGYLGEDDENLSDSQEEEWVADFVSDILHSPDALVRMAFAMNRHRSGTGASFLKRVQGFIERIKQGLAGYGQGAKGAIARSDLKTAEDAVIEALAKYADYRKSGTQPTGRLDIPFSLKPRDPNSATSITGDLARINAPAREAAEARLARLPKAEQDRVRATLEEHKSTPWAAAAIKGMVYREMLERARAGEDISALESNPVWGNQNMANTKIIKAFKAAAKVGDAAIRKLVLGYDFIGNNRKAEKDISTSFLNCDPSKACAEHCYAADANARPNEIAKSEFTEYALENFPEEVADRVGRLYAVSNLADAGLALRLNDKGDLSDVQVDLVQSLNDKGITLQVFSKRPELLRKLNDANLKMLSVDSTNIEKASSNPDLQLAVTTTDGMTEDMLIPVQDRIAVVLPVNLKGVHHSKETLSRQFPNLARSIIKDSLCPVEIGTFRTEPGISFVEIEVALKSKDKKLKEQYKDIWTCTACDKLGTVGCFHGDRQTSQRKAKYLYEDSARKRMQVRQIQKDIEEKLRELKALGYDVGDLRGELHKRLGEAHDAGQPEVRTSGEQGASTGVTEETGSASQGNQGSGGGSGQNDKRRRFVITPVDDGPKFSNRKKPLQDDLFRQQLDIFLDSDPAGQSGPKTQAAKRAAAAAVESLRGSDRGVLGRRLADTYAARQRVSLVGHTVNSREDVATLAQVYRDPRFETFRMFFLDQQGKIVSQVGLSSRLPSSSAVIVGSDTDKYLTDLAKAASKAGAVSYYMLHNHPSTNPMPSNADVNLTKKFEQDLNLISNGHVIIDTNRYGYIYPDGNVAVYEKDFGQVSPYKANEYSSHTINNPATLMDVAKKIEVDNDAVTLIAVAASHKVLGVTTIPSSVIKDSNQSRRTLRIRKALKALNGAKAFAVGTDRTALMKMTGLVMDSIHINEAGEFNSMNEQLSGAYGMSDPFVVRGRNVPRVTADTSPEFDYLRNQTQALRTGKAAAAPGVAEEGPKFSNRKLPETINQDGVNLPTTDSSGRPIHTTEEGVRNFWRWMNDGMERGRVDQTGRRSQEYGRGAGADEGNPARRYLFSADGRPHVYFHGTADDIRAFEVGHPNRKDNGWLGRGIYVTNAPSVANSYTNLKSGSIEPNVMPLYIGLQNPYVANLDFKQMMSRLSEAGVKSVTRQLISAGHDGVVLEFGDGTQEIAVFDPTRIKSSIGNSGEFDASDPDIRFSNRRAPTFYSQLARGFDTAKQDSMPGSQWRAWLFSNQAKLGIKADEIAWTGIEDFLKLKGKEKTSKADIAAFLADNGVQVNELVKSDQKPDALPRLKELVAQEDNLGYDSSFEAARDLLNGSLDANQIDVPDDMRAEIVGLVADYQKNGKPTKFSQYTIPGGENYRELLITLPVKQSGEIPPGYELIDIAAEDRADGLDIPVGETGPWRFRGPNVSSKVYKTREEALAALLKEAKSDQESGTALANYRSSHWDEPNVLAHLRFDERQDADGARVMFVQEIQSDWGQEGKKKGFTVKSQTADDYDITQNDTGLWIGENRNTGVTVGATTRELLEQRITESAQKERGKTGVPNAPFVTDTKSWTALSIKRAIRFAAENGFDKVAFANGQQNADLYDLSKQVDQIAVPMVNADSRSVRIDTGQGQSFKLMVSNDGVVTGQRSSDQFTGKTLDEVVGKDMADKIMALDAPSTFSGEGLKVGGEGMRYFYDNLVPSVANDVLKKLGGGRVGTANISVIPTETYKGDSAYRYAAESFLEGGSSLDEAISGMEKAYPAAKKDEIAAAAKYVYGFLSEQPSFTITPAMRDKVLGEGMPLFSNRRNVLDQIPLANWTAPDEAKLDDWIYKLADKQIDTKRVVEKLKASDAWNPYQKETLYHGKAEYETNNFKVNEVKPLLDAMSTRGISIGDLETYLWNRHAPEANDYYARVNPDQFPDGGSGIKTQDALNYLANLPAGVRTDLEAIANQVDAILRETRDILVREGLETQETIDAWEAAYQHYIPLHRESAEISERGMGTGQGFSVKGPASKRRTGSGKAAADILAQVMMQRERVITRAEKNRVALSLYGLAIQNPNPGFWYAVNPDAITQPAKVAQELIDQGMLDTDIAGIIKEPTEARINPRTGLVEHKINPMLRNRPNVLAVRIKGKDRFLFFSTEDARAVRMAESLKNLDAADLGGVWNLFRTVTRYVSSINTQYNPIFGVVNLIRDTQGGLLNLSSTPLAGQQGKVMANIGPALRGIYADLRADRKGQPRSGNEWSKLWEEFQQVGGKTGYRDMFRTAEDRGDALQKELQKAAEGKVKRFGRGVFDWLSDYNETLENAVRLSAYKAGIESGMTKDQSAVLAKDLTVNFNRKGQIASQMGSLYAFFNASAQGSVRLAQTLKGPAGKKIMAGGILLGVMQSVLMAMAGYDDDEPPEFVRERNFILPIGGGKYLTVPYPLGFHALPNMGRVVTDIALSGGRDGSKKVAGLLGSLFETFNPIGSAGWSAQTIAPTFADPFVALSENRDSFGKPIAKEDRSSLSPTPGFSRTKDTASVLSKKLAWGINRLSGGSEYTQGVISPTPDQLDFLFGQVTGGVGREVMKLEQAATSWMSGEELPPYKYPLGVGRFIGNTNAQASDANRFYANLTRLNELEAELKGRAKEGEDVRGFMQDNPEASLVGMANAAETTVTKLRSMKRKMIAAKRPKAEVKQIETRIQSVMKSLNDRVRPMRESPIERALRN